MISQEPTPFDAFPPQVREDVNGLIWLGYLEDEFTFCGHNFVIRLLRGDEELLAALVIKEYTETVGQAKAQVWATVALALTAVDGAEDFCPPASPAKEAYARARFQWVTGNWYWPVALFIYTRYTELLQRQNEAMEALEDFCNGNPSIFSPWPGSSTDKASSPPQSDIREFLNPEDFPSPEDGSSPS